MKVTCVCCGPDLDKITPPPSGQLQEKASPATKGLNLSEDPLDGALPSSPIILTAIEILRLLFNDDIEAKIPVPEF